MVRILFVTTGCQFCRKTIFPVEEVNLKIPIEKRIASVDAYEWENFKMAKEPIIHKLSFSGYPTIFLDGIKVKNILTKNQTRAFLDGFTQKDKIIEDSNKLTHD